MNGIPKIEALRSISLYGLSSVTMNFQYDTDPYFARAQAFERIPNADVPDGVSPEMSPLFSPSGLIYRYVLQSPDRSAQELKIIQDWVLSRKYRSIQGVADLAGLGGTTMQYQVLLDPARMFSYGVSVQQISDQLAANNANAGGGFYSQGGQFFYVRGLGLVKDLADIGNIVVATHDGMPVYVKDVATVTIGHAPRLGQFGYMHQHGRGRGRGADAGGRAGAGRAEEGRGDDRHAQPERPAARRQDRPLLRPHRADRRDHAHGRAQPGARHDPRARDPRAVPVQRPHGADRRRHDPVRAAVLVHLPRLGEHPGEPAVDRRHRLRHDRGRRGRDGREHLPRTGGAPRQAVPTWPRSSATRRATSSGRSSTPSRSSSRGTCRSTC